MEDIKQIVSDEVLQQVTDMTDKIKDLRMQVRMILAEVKEVSNHIEKLLGE